MCIFTISDNVGVYGDLRIIPPIQRMPGTPIQLHPKVQVNHPCGWVRHSGGASCLFGSKKCRRSCKNAGARTGECKWSGLGCYCHFGPC